MEQQAKSSNRKRPSPDERLELIVPAHLKRAIVERAEAERLPARVLVRLAVERYLAAQRGEASAA